MALKPLNKRVRIFLKGQPDLTGALYELEGYSNVLPQYFAVLDDGTERDLRNDNYCVTDDA